MERSVAIKKLRSILGKSLGYRIDPRAPDHEAREAARSKLSDATRIRSFLDERMKARRLEILNADPEYQELKTDYDKACKLYAALSSTSHHYRITVGTTGALFFTVKAQGDSWEEVISKLTDMPSRKAAALSVLNKLT